MRLFVLVTTTAACFSFPMAASGHSGRSVSYSDLVVQEASLGGTMRIADEDLVELLALDANRDGKIDAAELSRGTILLGDYVRNNFRVSARPPGDASAPFRPCELAVTGTKPPRSDDPARRIELTLAIRCGFAIDDVALRVLLFQGGAFSHEHRATVRLGGATRLLFFDARTQEASVMVPLGAQVGGYLLHGIHHILTGYDHLVFLFALLLLGGSWRVLLGIVTSFTVAHSITLMLGAFGVVQLPTVFVESAIALSIAYVGVENFFVKRLDRRFILTFFLGLVHGFGFAGALAESGLPTKGFLLTLVSFNVGVELGQVAVVAALWPLLRWASKQPWHPRVLRALSLLVFLFGAALFVMRAFFDVG